MKKSLQSSEWVLVASMLVVMASLVLIAKVNAQRASSSLSMADLQAEEILVTITGAVNKPGDYKVPVGTSVGSVLRKAGLKHNANLRMLTMWAPIEASRQINVTELAEITVSVCGAVESPVILTLPVNSRISDLKSKLILSSEADKGYFRRRRLLRDGEKIEVPKKTVE